MWTPLHFSNDKENEVKFIQIVNKISGICVLMIVVAALINILHIKLYVNVVLLQFVFVGFSPKKTPQETSRWHISATERKPEHISTNNQQNKKNVERTKKIFQYDYEIKQLSVHWKISRLPRIKKHVKASPNSKLCSFYLWHQDVILKQLIP